MCNIHVLFSFSIYIFLSREMKKENISRFLRMSLMPFSFDDIIVVHKEIDYLLISQVER